MNEILTVVLHSDADCIHRIAVTNPASITHKPSHQHYIDSNLQKICDSLLGKLEICVARSLLKALCVRRGELYLPDDFLQLLEINEIISALCTLLFFYAICSSFVHNVLFVR